MEVFSPSTQPIFINNQLLAGKTVKTYQKQHGRPGHEVDWEASSPERKMGLFNLQNI